MAQLITVQNSSSQNVASFKPFHFINAYVPAGFTDKVILTVDGSYNAGSNDAGSVAINIKCTNATDQSTVIGNIFTGLNSFYGVGATSTNYFIKVVNAVPINVAVIKPIDFVNAVYDLTSSHVLVTCAGAYNAGNNNGGTVSFMLETAGGAGQPISASTIINSIQTGLEAYYLQ
jgi:hypothetical protein